MESVSPTASGPSGSKRSYAQSCLSCKRRKIKCEGALQPPCKQCRTSNRLCEPASSGRAPKQTRVANSGGPSQSDVQSRLDRIERLLELRLLGSDQGAQSTSAAKDSEALSSELSQPKFAFGTLSQPVYHGETSMHDDPTFQQSPSKEVRTDNRTWSSDTLREICRTKHKFCDAQDGETWMNAYFSWASPCYTVVHKAVFIRDMALDGPFYSELLLVAIYCTGIRFTIGMDERERTEKGEQYLSIAMSLIAQEMTKPSSIPTIQALLAVAGRQVAVGNSSQSWLLTGLAIRMMQDMGIHLPTSDTSDTSRFTAEEREMRTRVYWAAYLWDKTIAVAMGREPALLCRPGHTPSDIPDDEEDEETWRPFLLQKGINSTYPQTLRLTTFTLRHSCRLYMILESILTNMYSPERPNARSFSFIRSAHERLNAWRHDLPQHISLLGQVLPKVAPPPHVVLLNLVYHVSCILLFRPLLTARDQSSSVVSNALDTCRTAAIGMHNILALWGRTFGVQNLVYLTMYCCFVAAGVEVTLLGIGDTSMRQETLKRVYLLLDILEKASSQGPGVRRGIEIIRTQLQREISDRGAVSSYARTESVAPSLLLYGSDAQSSTFPFTSSDSSNGFFDTQSAFSGYSSNQAEAMFAGPFNNSNKAPGPTFDYANVESLRTLLGQPTTTEDPFAFLTSDGWLS